MFGRTRPAGPGDRLRHGRDDRRDGRRRPVPRLPRRRGAPAGRRVAAGARRPRGPDQRARRPRGRPRPGPPGAADRVARRRARLLPRPLAQGPPPQAPARAAVARGAAPVAARRRRGAALRDRLGRLRRRHARGAVGRPVPREHLDRVRRPARAHGRSPSSSSAASTSATRSATWSSGGSDDRPDVPTGVAARSDDAGLPDRAGARRQPRPLAARLAGAPRRRPRGAGARQPRRGGRAPAGRVRRRRARAPARSAATSSPSSRCTRRPPSSSCPRTTSSRRPTTRSTPPTCPTRP